MKIIGREKEIKIIKNCYESNQSEIVALYGRRRIGKTYLINNYFINNFDFKFTATYHSSTANLQDEFQIEINSKTGKNIKTPSRWFEILENLKTYLISLNKDKVIVFVDELPWLDTRGSNFIDAFSHFINTWDSDKCLLKLYICGSATSWMINNLIGDKGGLYGRITRQIHLSPFSLEEVEEYILQIKNIKMSRKQILDLYMIVGGVPYYLNLFDYTTPIVKNIDSLFFDVSGALKTEFNFLFESLFNQSGNYKKIICALATKLCGLNREELIKITKINGGYLTEILDTLKKCDFIRSYTVPTKKSKGTIYQLIDLFSLFHLRFVDENDGQDPMYWSHVFNTNLVNSWRGYAYEQICFIHSEQIKKALGINGILTNIYSWKSDSSLKVDGDNTKGGQIDFIIDRNDGTMNVCEIKYSKDEYIITKDYEERIRNRTNLFIQSINTRKNILNTFITTYGVSKNDIVDNELTYEDLFIK